MEDVRTHVQDFLNKCEEIKKSKFIMAPTKIKDLLKSIVNSRELYDLFGEVTADFDYLTAKSQCIIDSYDGFSSNAFIVLPQSDRDRLAFIFCLLVEIDRDSINFNSFLQKYFKDDGSYYGSYYAFCEQIIDPLERIIRNNFSKELDETLPFQPLPMMPANEQAEQVTPEKPLSQSQKSILLQMLTTINLLIAQEKQFISDSPMPSDDKQTGHRILSEIYNALKEKRFNYVDALVAGYNYYILYNNSISANIQLLLDYIQRYEESQ